MLLQSSNIPLAVLSLHGHMGQALVTRHMALMQVLDPALLRPGRLSRRVTIPLPDETGRANILAVHLRSTPMLSDQDRAVACEQIARLTSGFSGAELANVVNEAALLTGRDGRKVSLSISAMHHTSDVQRLLAMHMVLSSIDSELAPPGTSL